MSDPETTPGQPTPPSGPEPLSPRLPEEEAPGTSQTIDEAIRVGNYSLAERKLEQYRVEYGKTPHYLYFMSKVKLGQKDYPAANELLKTLYFQCPVFMADRFDYDQFKKEFIAPPLERARTQWAQVMALLASKDQPEKEHREGAAEETAPDGTAPEARPEEAAPGGKKAGLSVQERDEVKKQLGKVAADYQRVLAIEPRHPDALAGLSQCCSEMGNAEEVLRLKERLDLVPAYWEGLRQKRAEHTFTEAKKAFREENLELSNRILNLGLEGVPDHPALLVLKGEILLKKKMFKEAMSCIELVLRRFPNHTEAARARGKIQAARFEFDFDRAQELLAAAEDLPTGSTSQVNKAHEALDYFLEALNYDPANMLALGGVYRCHMLGNNPLKAHQALARIKDLDPHFKVPGPKIRQKTREEEFMPDPCFVATRLFGARAPETDALRRFRDRRLRPAAAGRLLIAAYRRLGPALARLPGRGPLLPALRAVLRRLAPLVDPRP
ncbi:MAG: hypothetical protein GX442_19080 [Candidatus Riflebacteria bacterium]|nr:hypothetical protein [Candidatus Riflebacteria bacterium]